MLSQDELDLVSLVKRGKDYSLAGRLSKAEAEFRKAMEIAPGNAGLYSDLGFVLHGQDRLREAEFHYRKSLELSPNNPITLSNLAKLLFEQGRFENSLEMYIRLLDLVNSFSDAKLSEIAGENVRSRVELISIYRNIATIKYTIGALDDAMCYSLLAYLTASSEFQVGQHVRLLMSLDRSEVAAGILRDTVIARSGEVSPKILLDYGVALFATGDARLADTALSRALTKPGIEVADRRTARLLKLSMSLESESRAKEAKALYEALIEEEDELCDEAAVVDNDGYWPLLVTEAVESLMDRICNNEKQPLFPEEA